MACVSVASAQANLGPSSPLSAAADAASRARPPRVVLLAPAQTEDAARWAEAVRALATLGVHAVQVADLPIDPVLAACRSAQCALRVAQAASLPAVLVSLVQGSDVRLQLEVIAPDGAATSSAALLSEERGPTLSRLFSEAWLRLALGTAGLLRVDSVPSGGIVSVDGTPCGVTPYAQALVAGEHTLRVELTDFTSLERSVAIASGSEQRIALHLSRALPVRASGMGVPGVERSSEGSALNLLFAGALAIAALPTLTSSLNALANDGQCLQSNEAGCVERARFGTVSALLLAAGSVSLLGAGYFVIAQPVRVTVMPTGSGAGVRLRGQF